MCFKNSVGQRYIGTDIADAVWVSIMGFPVTLLCSKPEQSGVPFPLYPSRGENSSKTRSYFVGPSAGGGGGDAPYSGVPGNSSTTKQAEQIKTSAVVPEPP